MKLELPKGQLALAIATALSAGTIGVASADGGLFGKPDGTYVAGDFHNHTTCSDGSISMEKLVKKATDRADTPWGLDWFVQAGHGGNGNRNCQLVEDASLSTPAYPFVAGMGPNTTWENSGITPKVALPSAHLMTSGRFATSVQSRPGRGVIPTRPRSRRSASQHVWIVTSGWVRSCV